MQSRFSGSANRRLKSQRRVGKVILIDPFITQNPKTPEALKDLSKLKQVDLVLLTHGHGDHVGDTAAISKDYNAKVAMNADMGHTFAALGWVPYDRLIRFNKSGPITPLGDGIRITMVHAEQVRRWCTPTR